MIKNIVFDLGNVLVRFAPHDYLARLGYGEESFALFDGIIFGESWNLYDRGDYKNVSELREALCERYPEYTDDFHRILKPDWVKIHTLIADTAELLKELKGRGYRIFILSNLSFESFEYLKSFEFFRYTDGEVFSCFEHICKPDEGLYRILLERYSLDACETVFLDDRADNIETARRLGIKGIVFTDTGTAKKELEACLAQD